MPPQPAGLLACAAAPRRNEQPAAAPRYGTDPEWEAAVAVAAVEAEEAAEREHEAAAAGRTAPPARQEPVSAT
jgi:hypothetical protein